MEKSQNKFSRWVRWENRSSLEGLRYPGVYALAISQQGLTGRAFSYREEIVYFGMTNSKGGLSSRLDQFERTIDGKTGHGGAMRFRAKYKKAELVKKLFVSVNYTVCEAWKTPKDLILMGEIAKLEYECQATYMKKFKNRLPEFNDKERSPK